MTTNYEIWLTNDFGGRLATLDNFIRLECSRVANKIGKIYIDMPLSFDLNLVQPDYMIQIWRQPRGGRLGLWRIYFLREWEFSTSGGQQRIKIGGPDINDLLRRRIVAAYSASAQARKTDLADDMMKEIVTEALADGVAPVPAAGTRVWADLSVAADNGLGPSVSKSFSFDPLLTVSGSGVLPQVADAAYEAGTLVFFDIVPNVVASNSISFRFETYIDQPGQDLSSLVTFDQDRENMTNPVLRYDYNEEENYIYAAGPGEEDTRNVQQVSDSTRYSASQWARCEGFTDARNEPDDNTAITNVGRSKLNEGRPKVQFNATPVDTEGTTFGIHWNFGDKVRAKYLNRQFNSIIDAVMIVLDENGEDIQAKLNYESEI